MLKKRLYLLMGSISTLLVVLLVIQIVWLKNAALAERRETKLRTGRALARVEEQLRNANYCVLSYGKVFVNPGEVFYMLRTDARGRTDTVNMFFDGQYTSSGQIAKESRMDFPFPFTTDIQLKSTAIITDTASYYKERKEFYEKLTGKQFKDIITSQRPIDDVFDMNLVDSLIRTNLKAEHLDTVYGFGFVYNDLNRIAFARRTHDSAALLSASSSIRLFTDNQFIRPYRLALLFPAMSSGYVVNAWLWLSVAVVLLLTLAFYVFIRLYLKQTRLSEMKSDFIHNLTHEFNTPMANISLAVETLESNGRINDPKLNNILHIISSESSRLRDNIERSLQIATLEKGNLRLQREYIDLVQMVHTTISSYQWRCRQLGGQICFAHNGKAVVLGDETHLLNCCVNLLDNAIKYRSGPPEIEVALEEKDGTILLSVADKGKGMSGETQKHIFEKFYRAHEGDTHNTKGFGLGLSYVKGIVEAHGGKIEVWSRKGVGTTFTIKLFKAEPYGVK